VLGGGGHTCRVRCDATAHSCHSSEVQIKLVNLVPEPCFFVDGKCTAKAKKLSALLRDEVFVAVVVKHAVFWYVRQM
jgi:hypothetical protein